MRLQSRFLLLLLLIFLSVGGILTLQRYYDGKRSQSLLSSELETRKKIIDKDLVSEGMTFRSLQTDYSFWDGMVSLAKDNYQNVNATNLSFAHSNIDTALSTYGADFAWVYNADGNLVYTSKLNPKNSINTIQVSKPFFLSLDKNKFLHYYVQTDQGILEVRAATLVPSNDPNHNDSASGYWIIARILGSDFVSSINDLSQSSVSFTDPTAAHADLKQNDTVTFSLPLLSWDGAVVKYLTTSAKIPSISSLNTLYKNELIVVGSLGLALSAVISFALWLTILKPLKVITTSIRDENPQAIDKYVNTKTQFGDLARTVKTFFTQQETIEKASKELAQANEELKKQDSVKNDFISMLSHQLGTPLTAMEGFLTLVVQGFYGEVANPKMQSAIEKTLSRTKHMKALVFDLLNVSRMTAGKFFMEISDVDMNLIVKDQVDELMGTANEKGVTLNYHEPSQKIPMMKLDEAKTRQAVLNLVNNAIFYTPKGGTVDVHLSLGPEVMEFKVIDTGIGVPEDAKDKLFTKFFRADNAREQSPNGTGIGLYLVKRVVADQKGSIIFSSQSGKGSTFGFTLPLHAELPKEFTTDTQSETSSTGEVKPPTLVQ